MKRGVHWGVALVAGLAVVPATLACGDRLAALGGGVRFERAFYSRNPARIVLYAPAATMLRAATDRLGVVAALERAGHTVRSVDDRAALEGAIRATTGAAPPDVVIVDAGYTQQTAVVAPGGVTVVPVAFSSARDARGAGTAGAAAANVVTQAAARMRGDCVVETDGRSLRQLLRAVENVLERRRRGDADACGATRTRAAN